MIAPLIGLALLATSAFSKQTNADPNVFVPQSSIPVFDDGLTVHTNFFEWIGPDQVQHVSDNPNPMPNGPSALAGPSGFYPADIRSAYKIPSLAGAKAIAVVDAYSYTYALSDFNTFSKQFGLPVETSTSATASTNKVLQVVSESTGRFQTNQLWGEEAAIDIEWAHAMAPNAKIYLVQATTNGIADMYAAVRIAASIPGVSEISMSWSAPEFSNETSYDPYLIQKGIVFLGSSGDSGIPEYPASSPNVVAVGGTSLKMANGGYSGETPWASSGGGPSAYEKLPAFQSAFSSIFKYRGSPDVAAVADPSTGVAVFYSGTLGNLGWTVLGGTSVACPIVAGIINASGTWATSSATELTKIYSGLGGANFRVIKMSNSNQSSRFPTPASATKGWNYITGVGTPLGILGF